jgi:hypothetical protein
MLKELKTKNIQDLKHLELFLKKINIDLYNKIYLFPANAYSNYFYKKLKKNKTYLVDNYLKKNCIKPSGINFHKKNILIATDKNLYKSQKFKNKLTTIFYAPKLHIDQKINLDKKKKLDKNLSKLFSYFNTDKAEFYEKIDFTETSHNYGKFYEKHFKRIKNKKLNILEIGSYRGNSSAAFLNYFNNSKIYCLDLDHKLFLFYSKRIKLVTLDYMKPSMVSKFCKKFENFFDIIIDDGGHYKSHILTNLNNFSNCLKKKKSLYVIEDYGLKFDYLNDAKNEPSISQVLKYFSNKKIFDSKILNEQNQIKLINGIKNIYVYKGDWIKYKKNISDICFLEIKNL